MTFHIKAEYACPKCSKQYIPFKRGVACFWCGYVDDNTEKYHGFLTDVLVSMTINKIKYGRYRPNAWYEGSVADRVQSTCFHFFDCLEKEKPVDKLAFLHEYVEKMQVDTEHSRAFIDGVLLELYKLYAGTKKPRLIRGRTRIGRMISNLLKSYTHGK
ncbi:MAG: hypothetical protein WCS89_02080 [Candidatus Paceibacterota bacterium]|jgi:hypothetical protein